MFEGYEKKERRGLIKRGVKIHPFHTSPGSAPVHVLGSVASLGGPLGCWSSTKNKSAMRECVV